MTQKYAVGDKVRILDVDGIWLAREQGYKNGDIADVIRLASKGQPFIPAKGGGKLVIARSELKYIEKAAEQMAKFNVGDKVRIISTKGQPLGGFKDGDIVTITDAYKREKSGEQRYEVVHPEGVTGYGGNETFELVNAKSTQDKPKKGERISALEQQVAELTAKVEALESAQKPAVNFAKIRAEFTPNEQRKAIIAEAKAFVEDVTNVIIDEHERETKFGRLNDVGFEWLLRAFFEVKADKREVTVVLKPKYVDKVVAKGIAKCAPDDVFNADIGKAIALGRALGLDVKRFEQAVKPTVAPGQMFKVTEPGAVTGTIRKIIEMRPSQDSVRYGKAFRRESGNWLGEKQGVITDDTDAQY